MPENIVAVRIAVRRHTVTHLIQFLHSLALLNPPEIPFQTPVHIIHVRMNRLIERIFFRPGRLTLQRGTVDQIRLLEALHLPEDLRRIQRIGRFCDHALLQASQTAFHRILPFLIRDIKKICKDMYVNRPSIPVAQRALQLLPRLLELSRIRFPVIIHILQGFLFLPEFFRRLPDRHCRLRQLFRDIVHGCFQVIPKLPAGLFRHLAAGEIIDQLKRPVAHIIRGSLIGFPAPQSVYDPSPVRRIIRQQLNRMLHLLEFLLLLSVITLLKFRLDVNQPVPERCQLCLDFTLSALRPFGIPFRTFKIIASRRDSGSASLNLDILQNFLRIHSVRPDIGQFQIRRMDRVQHLDPFLQIFHALPDLPVRSQLLTDDSHRILPALREHIVPDKLPGSAGHLQCDCALLHGNHPVRLHISENHLIEGIQIGFPGRIDTVHIPVPPVIHTPAALFRKFPDHINGIRDSVFQIFVLRHPSGMAEEIVASQFRIILPNLKSRADTRDNMSPRILDLHHDLRTEILPSAVHASILLSAPQVAEHASLILGIIRCFVEEISGHAAVEHHLDRVHDRGFSRAALSAEQIHMLVQSEDLVADAAPVIDQYPCKEFLRLPHTLPPPLCTHRSAH